MSPPSARPTPPPTSPLGVGAVTIPAGAFALLHDDGALWALHGHAGLGGGHLAYFSGRRFGGAKLAVDQPGQDLGGFWGGLFGVVLAMVMAPCWAGLATTAHADRGQPDRGAGLGAGRPVRKPDQARAGAKDSGSLLRSWRRAGSHDSCYRAAVRDVQGMVRAVRQIAVLGATARWQQHPDVIARHPERFRASVLSAHDNVEELVRLCQRFGPDIAIIANEAHYGALRDGLKVPDSRPARWPARALADVAGSDACDTVVAAIVGAAGLGSTGAARSGKRILLANKESIVVARC